MFFRAVLPRPKSSLLLAVLVLAASFSATAQKQRVQPVPKGEFVQDEVLVKLRRGISKKGARDALARSGAVVQEELGDLDWVRVKVHRGRNARSAAADLLQLPEVESAQPNYYYELAATPNDPMWLDTGLYGIRKISAPAAWDTTLGSPAVVVANIDSGMRYTHEDLAANMWTNPGEVPGNGFDDDGNGFADDYHGFDFFFDDPDPADEHGHGTHVAGTIGATGNNALGIVGVTWSVKLMAVKIFNSTGRGTTSAMLINAYNYVRMMKQRGVNIRVTNNSYSGADEAARYDYATRDAIDALGDAGILNVFAAGNNNQDNDTAPAPNYPASYTSSSVLAVAASMADDTRSSFSAYGANSVDIAAPGPGVLSTTHGSDSSYGFSSGTSMAAPHVTGAAALLAAFNPALSPASIKATLLNTVDTFASLGTGVEQNWANSPVRASGRLNVARALLSPTVCTFAVSSDRIDAGKKGGYHTLGVESPPNCDFDIRGRVRWAFVHGPDARSGNAQIRIRFSANPLPSRTAAIRVAGRTVTLVQSRKAAN